MVFISSHRIPNASFQDLADAAWRDIGVRVSRLDSQSLASTFFERGRATDVLKALGIDIEHSQTPTSVSSSASLEAAYSFLFFGDEPEHFRQQIVESALLTVAIRHRGVIGKGRLLSETKELLQLPPAQSHMIYGSIDRMLQRGELTVAGDRIQVSQRIIDGAKAIQIAREREWQSLRGDVRSILTSNASESNSFSCLGYTCLGYISATGT